MIDYFWKHHVCGRCSKMRKCKKVITKITAIDEWRKHVYSITICKECLKKENN